MRLKPGDTFRIKTRIGFGFLQYVETDIDGIEFVRVLKPISVKGQIDQSGTNQCERWNIGFPIKAAVRKKIIDFIGNFDIPETFSVSKYARDQHNVRGKIIGWHIINKSTSKMILKKELDDDDLKLSPYGIMDDSLIIERIESNWKLEDWR